MLNVVACDEYEIELLENSYRNIRQQDALTIVQDEAEQKKVLDQVIRIMDVPAKAVFSIKNLFRLSIQGKRFYIAQCINDFGMQHASGSGPSSYEHKFHLQIVGIANLKADLGKTLLRPETRIDKVVDWFSRRDIDFTYSEVFNDKYYLVSDSKDKVLLHFTEEFIDTIGKYEGVHLMICGREMCIWFDQTLTEEQSGIVEDIFSHCPFVDG